MTCNNKQVMSTVTVTVDLTLLWSALLMRCFVIKLVSIYEDIAIVIFSVNLII